jgi:hypothetical protein
MATSFSFGRLYPNNTTQRTARAAVEFGRELVLAAPIPPGVEPGRGDRLDHLRAAPKLAGCRAGSAHCTFGQRLAASSCRLSVPVEVGA